MIRKDKDLGRYCSEPLENIENYDKAIEDDKHMWDCHHRNEICEANRSRSDRGITTRAQLIADGMYWHRPACELIFLPHGEHIRLHHVGKVVSEDTRRKLAYIASGENLSDETRRRMSASAKARCLKNCKAPMRGRRWITNGVETRTIRTGEEIPCGWRIGRSLT